MFKLSNKEKGSFGKQDMDGYLLDLNLFWWPGNQKCVWELDQNKDVGFLHIDQQDNPDNFAYVRGYPRIVVGSAFGGWETYGIWKGLLKKISGAMRGDNNNIPRYDLTKVTELTGLPIQVKDMPDMMVYADAKIPGSLQASVFLDSYLWADKGDVNESITAKNLDKVLNLNIHLDRPAKNNTSAPGGGWSGGKVIAEITIDGVEYWVMYKREKAVQNDFDYCSFIPKNGRVTSLNLKHFYQWLYSIDFNALVRSHGLEPTGRFNSAMVDAWMGSICLGSEIWTGGGTIQFNKLSAKIGDRPEVGIGASKSNASVPTTAPVIQTPNVVSEEPTPATPAPVETAPIAGPALPATETEWQKGVQSAVLQLLSLIFQKVK